MIPWWQLEFAALVLERGKVGSITIRELVSASELSRQTVQRYLKDFERWYTRMGIKEKTLKGSSFCWAWDRPCIT